MNCKLSFAIGILFFTGCSVIRFTNPQPENARPLSQFPDQMIGSYLDKDGDTLKISRYAFSNGEEVNTLSKERLILKKSGKYYILSSKCPLSEGNPIAWKGWEVLPFRYVDNTLTVYLINTWEDKEKQTLEALKNILSAPVKNEFNSQENFDYYLISPTKKEFKTMLKEGIFNEEMKFSRIFE